ncbi:hypothetical protein GP486_000362 [Trichoglossum hirsutum]|uniref:NB-ARC domain-containing protein n=1 Tax=Trichoglossum hirsutum TaxID=265104 RepID=A0A9P8LIQ7_9PEZI|nr:hypothetical protein GP486_000362 [Trichoglossum hirsutum]
MAEAIVAIGIASSIATFICIACKVVDRISLYLSNARQTQGVFRELAIQLPHLVEVCEKIEEKVEKDPNKLHPISLVIQGCMGQVTELDDFIEKTLPVPGDSAITRTCKAIHSIRYERKVMEMHRKLETYKTSLMLQLGMHPIRADSTASEAKAMKFFYFPSSQVVRFVGREDLLNKIQRAFSAPASGLSISTMVILRGMGGQGKTQIALEYCRRSMDNGQFEAILWIDATSTIALTRSFENIADSMTNRERIFADKESRIRYVKEVLETLKRPWLMVFDNFDDPAGFKDITEYIPRAKVGAVLFTSRHADVERLGTAIPVSGMEEHEGVELLFRQTNYHKTHDNINAGLAVVRKLDCLPLAIDQAAAYISARNLPLHQFIKHYENRKATVLIHVPQLWEYRKRLSEDEDETSLSAFMTWEMSFQQLCNQNKDRDLITHILTLFAFFDNLNITEDLFRVSFEPPVSNPDWLKPLISGGEWDSFKFGDITSELQKLSLLRILSLESGRMRFSLHPLIRDWVQLRIPLLERQKYTIAAIEMLTQTIEATPKEKHSLEVKREILAHLDACLENDKAFLDAEGRLGLTSLRQPAVVFAGYYNGMARYQEAEDLFKRVLAGNKKNPDVGDTQPLESARNLASVYCNQGRYPDAQELLDKTLQESEERLGPDHPETLKTVMSLAWLFYRKGCISEASDLYKRALKSHEEQLPANHPDILLVLEELAQIHRFDGKKDEAICLCERALKGRQEQLGDDHVDTLRTALHLANAYRTECRYQEAERLYERVHDGTMLHLGAEHPLTIENINNQGIVKRNQGDFDKSEFHFDQIKETSKRILGPNHPLTLKVLMNLAILYEKQGRFSEAETLYANILEGRKKCMGLGHQDTMRTVECLSRTYWTQGRFDEADNLAAQVLKAKNIVPMQPPADMVSEQRCRWLNIETIQTIALRRGQRNQPNNVDTLETAVALGHVYVEQGRLDEAETLYAKVLPEYASHFGTDHPETLRLSEALANLYRLQGEESKAEDVYVMVFSNGREGDYECLGAARDLMGLSI